MGPATSNIVEHKLAVRKNHQHINYSLAKLNNPQCPTLSKRQLKSTCTQSPVDRSISRFSPCRSPRPRMCPTMDQTAVVRVNLKRALDQCDGVEKLLRNHLCRTGGNISVTLITIMGTYHADHMKGNEAKYTTRKCQLTSSYHFVHFRVIDLSWRSYICFICCNVCL